MTRVSDKFSYFHNKALTEPRLTIDKLDTNGIINLFEAIKNVTVMDADGDERLYNKLLEDCIRFYGLTQFLDQKPEAYIKPIYQNDREINYENLPSNNYNEDWRYYIEEYINSPGLQSWKDRVK